MKNIGLEHSRGFTLIELLVVIAILGVISATIMLNVGGFFAYGSGRIMAAASYTIFVEEEGVQKNIGTIDLGDMLIRYPRTMDIGDSKEVSLNLIPLGGNISESDVIVESTDEGTYYEVSEKVQLYSVMCAELKAASFTISSDSIQYREVSPTSRTDWVWVVTPNTNKVGEQLLIVELSTPVRVQGYEGLVSKAVFSQSFHILVRKPLDLERWQIIVSIISGVVVIGGAVFGVRKYMKRKKTQKTKK
jgi:prepilin-type N-terminal cleavage/methylation domain-containing protein